MSVSFGRTTQNSFPSGSARTVQDSAPVCPMSTRRAPSARRRSISWSRSAALLVRSRWTRFLVVLESVTGMKQMPRGAFSSVQMAISFSRSERTLQPSAWGQNRASAGRSWASMTTVVESDRHVARMGGMPACISRTRTLGAQS